MSMNWGPVGDVPCFLVVDLECFTHPVRAPLIIDDGWSERAGRVHTSTSRIALDIEHGLGWFLIDFSPPSIIGWMGANGSSLNKWDYGDEDAQGDGEADGEGSRSFDVGPVGIADAQDHDDQSEGGEELEAETLRRSQLRVEGSDTHRSLEFQRSQRLRRRKRNSALTNWYLAKSSFKSSEAPILVKDPIMLTSIIVWCIFGAELSDSVKIPSAGL